MASKVPIRVAFFVADTLERADTRGLPGGITACWWKPGAARVFGPKISPWLLAGWWLTGYALRARRREYRIFTAWNGSRLVHYSVVLPKSLRYPFMHANDLQIGPCWTDPEYRRRGLLTIAIRDIVDTLQAPDRRFWYVTREANAVSNLAIARLGFSKFGTGYRGTRLGLRALGAFVVDDPPHETPLGDPLAKRAFDVVAASLGLLLLSPVVAAVAMAIKIDARGPIFYRGARVGRFGKPFTMLKFRTMVPDAERGGGSSTPEDDPRLTRIGTFLRRTKMDELPQLVNVVRGEMSLVGPRPQVAWAVGLYSKEERALLSVRPGLTDYASIVFRNEAELLRGSRDPDALYLQQIAPIKIKLGLAYVRDRSFWLDLQIILTTAWAIVGGRPEVVLSRLEALPRPVWPASALETESLG